MCIRDRYKSKCDPADLRAADSNFYCCSSENCKETVEQILEQLYKTGRFFFREPAGSDNFENLSGGPEKSGGDGWRGAELPQNYDESFDNAA